MTTTKSKPAAVALPSWIPPVLCFPPGEPAASQARTADELEAIRRAPELRALALKYSEAPAVLGAVLDALIVRVEFLGVVPGHFEPGDERRPVFRITLERYGRAWSFTFGSSVASLWLYDPPAGGYPRGGELVAAPWSWALRWVRGSEYMRKLKAERAAMPADLLYSVMCCVASDYHVPAAFSEFCAEFGYDVDSRRALATWERCGEFAASARRMFSEDEITSFPS